MTGKARKTLIITCIVVILAIVAAFIMQCISPSKNSDIPKNVEISSQDEMVDLAVSQKDDEEVPTKDNADLTVTISYFDDILGFPGYYKDTLEFGEHYIREYYSGSPESDNSIKLGESWNFEIDNYVKDIDNDSVNELICNCRAHMNGHRDVLIYRWNGHAVEIGYVDWLKHRIDGLFYWGFNAVQTQYDDKTGKILIDYCPKEGNQDKFSTIEVDSDWLSFELWDGENFPSIDIDKAYELYGELN